MAHLPDRAQVLPNRGPGGEIPVYRFLRILTQVEPAGGVLSLLMVLSARLIFSSEFPVPSP
jgi:hypothetical protein